MSNDPFSFDDPDEIASEFASLDSFRQRVVMITPTAFDPENRNDEGKLQPKYTATITTVDGKGKVQQFANKAPTGSYLEGPVHAGVWLSQERIVKSLKTAWAAKSSVIGIPETYKPGRPSGKGNPWGLLKATDDQKKAAREFLANLAVSGSSDPAEETGPAENPFGK